MGDRTRYESPAALRRALTDRLKSRAADGPWPLPALQRQFAYERLLARCYAMDGDWVVKGAAAMLARGIAVRHTLDIDVYRDAEVQEAVASLRRAADLDLGDWMTFRLGRSTTIEAGSMGARVPVEVSIGVSVWTRFHVDVVGSGLHMTGTPEPARGLVRVELAGIEIPNLTVYPLVDHLADKFCAIVETHGSRERISTRYKDLIDLPALIGADAHDANAMRRALDSEAGRRRLDLPTRFVVPDPAIWSRGYRAEAARAEQKPVLPYEDAARLVGLFLDPLLQGGDAGSWDPAGLRWSGGDESSCQSSS